MIRLNMQQVLLLHEELIQETGGIHGFEMRTCLSLPLQLLSRPSTISRCIRRANRRPYDLLWSCDESSFLDGNKRIVRMPC